MVVAEQDKFLEYVQSRQHADQKSVIALGHLDAIRRELERTGSFHPGLRILDVGCGKGLYSVAFARAGYQVAGVDLNEKLIDLAREFAAKSGTEVDFRLGVGNELPFEDESFDIVFANSLLEHVPDWKACLREWSRVLAPEGVLWVETTNVIHPRQAEYRWLPLYSWWPAPLKKLVVKAASGPFPALANYTPWPAVNWFSFFQLRRFLTSECGISEVRDRFHLMDETRLPKRIVKRLALSSQVGLWLAYLLVPTVIVLARKPKRS
jgi:2-polyprenyl-6-hydroxyphenyl methylase/3-demethylubiquinone-9 3-methyltransferase